MYREQGEVSALMVTGIVFLIDSLIFRGNAKYEFTQMVPILM
jgi:hypothetical protein